MVMKPAENAHSQTEQTLLDDAEKLIWALLDDQIEADDAKRLEALIRGNEQVRLRYMQCAEIHADLYSHFQTGPVKPSPVLGSLPGDMPVPLGGTSSLAE
jgi:hypothetical protein